MYLSRKNNLLFLIENNILRYSRDNFQIFFVGKYYTSLLFNYKKEIVNTTKGNISFTLTNLVTTKKSKLHKPFNLQCV